jgi:hypothetical protein
MISKRARDYLAMILSSIVFYIPLFLRSFNYPFIGNDSYYFLNYIFYDVPLHVSSFVQEFLFGLFPANLFVIKLIMLITTIISLFIFYETVELIKKNRGLIASLFLLCYFWFSWIFIKFEDDLFGFPFIMLSLYFLIKYLYSDTKKKYLDKNIIFSLFFLLIGVLIWNFAVYYLIAFLFISQFHRLYLFSNLCLLPFLPKLINGVMPSFLISENFPIKGLLVLMLFSFLYFKEFRIKETFPALIVFSALTLINTKFIYITIPILLLNLSNVSLKHNKKLKNVMIFLLLLFFSISMYQNLIMYPSVNEYELISIAQQLEKDTSKDIYFQWSLGYFGIWHNFDVNHFGTPPKNEIDYKNKIILTVNGDKKIESCKIIKKSKWITLAEC